MNKKYYTIGGLLVFLCLIIVVVFPDYARDEENAYVPSVNPILIPYKKKLTSVYQSKELDEKEKKALAQEVIDSLPEPYRRRYQIAFSSVPDLSLYGRVIDQYNQPVTGAAIWQNGGSAFLRTGAGRGYAGIDEDGYFRIDTTGVFLKIGGIVHPEIDHVNYRVQHKVPSSLYDATIRFDISPSGYEGALNINDYDTKEKAFIIKTWRLKGYEGAVSGRANLPLQPDGQLYTLNLDQKNDIHKLFKQGQHEGDLLISCTREGSVQDIENINWQYTITPINGGIQSTQDLYLNEAPVDGYQSSVTITIDKDVIDYYKVKSLNQRFYFKAHNEKMYGVLYAHFLPFWTEDKCLVELSQYRFNPNGSRNLETQKQQSSTPPVVTGNELASNQR